MVGLKISVTFFHEPVAVKSTPCWSTHFAPTYSRTRSRPGNDAPVERTNAVTV